MPTYQYRCPSCGYEFEEFQSITDDPIEICPKCKKETHRIISGGAGLIFKGSGFYATDYRSDSYKKSEARDKSDSQVSKSSSDKKDSSKSSDTSPGSTNSGKA